MTTNHIKNNSDKKELDSNFEDDSKAPSLPVEKDYPQPICLSDLNDFPCLNDLDNNINNKTIKTDKDNKDSKTPILTPPFLENFKSKGNKEYILYYLYGKVKSTKEIDTELSLSINCCQKVIERSPNLFEEDHKELNKKFWRLSALGKLFVDNEVEKIKKTEQELKDNINNRTLFNSKEDLTLQIPEIISNLNLKAILLGLEEKPILNFDCKLLSEINPKFCDFFLENFLEAKEKIKEYIFEHFDKEPLIRPFNLPNSCEVNMEDLSTKFDGKLIKTVATIEYRSDSKEAMVLQSKFECGSCGTILTINQNGDIYKSPSRCSCGRRGGFKHLSDSTIDFLEVIIRNKDITKTRTRLYLEIQGDDMINYLNEKLGNGKSIEIVGVYKTKPKYLRNQQSTKLTGYILAESIKSTVEEKINISDEDIRKIEEVGQDFSENGFKNIRDIIFPSAIYSHIGQEVLSNALILQAVTGKNKINEDGTKEIEAVSLFCYGDPAVNKSRRIEALTKRIDPSIQSVNGSTASSAGLLLGMDTFENKRFVSGGLLAQANNSIVVIDEIQKFDKEARGSLHDVLASQSLKYNKVGFNINENLDICMTFIGNPQADKFDSSPIYKQVQQEVDKFGKVESNFAFLSRCDFVIGIRDVADLETNKKISLAIQNRATNNEVYKYKLDTIKKYIYYVKNKIDPLPTEESIDKIAELVSLLRTKVHGYYISNRITEAYMRASKCFAKLRLSDYVELIDVERAHNLYIDSLRSLEVQDYELNFPLSSFKEKK